MSNKDPRDELIEHLPALRAFAITLTRNPSTADDMVQDAVEKAWRNFDKFQVGTNLRAWLFTILRNTYYSSLRKTKREVSDPEGTFVGQMSEKPAHDGHLQMAEFRTAFEELPDEQREALILVGAGGFSYEEAAKTCGVAVGTIKSRANRGRKRLAELLHLDEDEPMEMTETYTMAVVSGGGRLG
jgi:RNA polymerase sigma-70 factor (ECF subfamily)